MDYTLDDVYTLDQPKAAFIRDGVHNVYLIHTKLMLADRQLFIDARVNKLRKLRIMFNRSYDVVGTLRQLSADGTTSLAQTIETVACSPWLRNELMSAAYSASLAKMAGTMLGSLAMLDELDDLRLNSHGQDWVF